MSLIEAEALYKSFSIPSIRRDTIREHLLGMFTPRHFQRLQVLAGVSFNIERGEALGIMGRNGCGKSTLLRIVCGVYPPDQGRVVARASMTPILELGVGWNHELDAIDNVTLIGGVLGLSLKEVRQSMDDILAFAELQRFANLPLKHYSSGMSVRLAYAVAFHAVREVLVLDEIFAVGDAGFKARCEARYVDLRARGHAAIIVSHDPRIISRHCDRALLLDAGRVVLDGPAADVANRYLALLAEPT